MPMPQSPSSSAASAASVQVRPRPCSKRPGQAATTSARKRAKDRANVPNTHGSSDFDAVSVSSATGRPKRNIHPALSDASISGILGEDQDDLDSLTREVEFDEVIMALNLREELTMGCAYYHTQEGILYLAQEVTAATTDIAEQFIIHVQPTTIILSGRAPEELINFLEKKSQDTIGREDTIPLTLKVVSSSQFDYSSAQSELINTCAKVAGSSNGPSATLDMDLNVGPYDDQRYSGHIKALRCSACVNLDDLSSVSCAGAVLADLQRRRSIGILPNGQSAQSTFHIDDVQMFSLSDFMFVNSDSLISLQIVQSELHPNGQGVGFGSRPNGAKESLSIYGLFHQLASSPQGRTALRRVFLRPSLDRDLITERQRTIVMLLQPQHSDLIRQAAKVLRRIKNIRGLMTQLKKGINSPASGHSFNQSVWATLRGFAAQTLKLREIMNGILRNCDMATIIQLQSKIQPRDLISVGDLIDRTIDFEQSKARQRASVRSGIDRDLDELKKRYDGMAGFLTAVVKEVSQLVPEWAREYIRSCIFLPQLGFLMVVEPDETGRGKYEGEGTEDDHWERLFTADGAVCYKNRCMKELDEQYGDMYCEIGDREVEIMHDLAKLVLNHESALTLASDVCGEFNALLALARGAEKYGWSRPHVVDESIIHIKGGRHPLQELVVPSFIPNDCNMPQDNTVSGRARAMILTGPNQSGKSIYLKQVAIIVYLTHIGSFVPADQADIGLTDKILTRISAKESVSRNESAFAIDLRQITQSVRFATSRTLVLVDEFGKGTNGDDGAGLLAGLVDHFLSFEKPPRLLLATHFHELIEGNFLRENGQLVFAHMSVQVNANADRTEDEVVYLFQLLEGYSSSSMGSRCAALNGVPRAIVERSEAISRLLAKNEDITSACAKLTQDEEVKLERAEIVARQFLESDIGLMSRPTEAKSLLERILGSGG